MQPTPLIARLLLLAAFSLALVGQGRGQQYNVLHRFGDGSVPNDGILPKSIFQGFDGNFYGVCEQGGSSGYSVGAVFEMTQQGTVSILYSFNIASGLYYPRSLIQAADGNFYGTTSSQIFKLTPAGQLSLLHALTTTEGSSVNGIIQAGDGNFYGTTEFGGSAGDGTVFKITPQGSFTLLHTFDDGSVTKDGIDPTAGLVQGSDGNFYGTTQNGGTTENVNTTGIGTVFKMTPQGTITILHSFGDGSVQNDGINPEAALIQGTDGNFYGTTQSGGTATGTAFKITPQGTVTILHNFGDGSTFNDGDYPETTLVQGYDGSFYGMTSAGSGPANLGTIFQMTPQGAVTTLHSFGDGSVANDGTGIGSLTPLIQTPAGNFYGVTPGGDESGQGTVYSIAPSAPILTSAITASGSLSVPFSYQTAASNNPIGYSATNLPDGLSIDGTTGLISGTPTTVQTKIVTLTISNASGSSNFSMTIAIGSLPAPSITSILTSYGSVGATFTYNISASNNPTSYGADDASLTRLAAANLSLDPSTGVISGTPTSAGTITVNLTATNTTGTSSPVALSIQILAAPPTLSQEYSVLHRFGDGSVNNDGISPQSIIQAFDGNFYGVTYDGGSNVPGTVFEMTQQGTISIFYSFKSFTGVSNPTSLIQAADGNFYGTATSGGGQVFKLTQSGQLSVLHAFGVGFLNGIIQAGDGNFYGTTEFGGSAGDGTAFKITPQGSFTVLHTFNDGSVTKDGIDPTGDLVQGSDGNFYGTTQNGGTTENVNTTGIGTVFKMTPQGTVTILHSFGDGSVQNDGINPEAALIQGTDGNFYGTTQSGGSGGDGTAFKITPQGTVTILHNFGDGSTLNDGNQPDSALIQGYDGNFYGTTYYGGSASDGTVFQITPAGVETILHNFGDGSVTNDGNEAGSISALIQSSAGNFYGVTSGGGTTNQGTVYSIQAMQQPTHVPIYFGAAYEEASVLAPFFFTPKAAFGVSGSGNVQTNAVKPQTTGGIMDALVSLFVPQSIHKNFSVTNWMLNELGVGAVPPNTLQPLYLTFDPTSGTISGTPTQGGTYALTMTPSNANGSGTPQPVTIYIDVPPAISSAATATCAVGTPFSYQIASTPPTDSYGATSLPAWLSVDPVAGLITGTPPAAGTYVFNTIASNLSGQTVQPVALTVTGGPSSVPAITSSTVASGAVGNPFNYHIVTSPAATNFTALVPPIGLAFDATTSTIRGTPNTTGFFQIPITATNSSGSSASVLSLTILPPTAPTIASTLTALIGEGNPFTYAIPATGVVSAYAETGNLPAGLMFNTSTGVISGTPTATGTFTLNITVSNDDGAAAATLTFKVETATNFGGWSTTYGVTGGAVGTPYHDGVPNLLKYLYNVDPSAPISATDRAALPVASTATISGIDCQTLTFRQSALQSGLTVSIQTSPDLRNWTTVATEPSSIIVQLGTDPTTGDPIMQAQVPLTSTPQFVRLNVTQP